MTALRAFVTVGTAALFLFLAAVPMFMDAPLAYTGTHVQPGPRLVGPAVVRVDPGSPAARAGIRTGDTIACYSLRDRKALLPELLGSAGPFVAGRSIPLCTLRNGVMHTVRIPLEARPAAGLLYSTVWITVLRLAVFAVFALVGILLVIARPGPLTWIFFAYCLGSVPSYAASINNTVLSPLLYLLIYLPLATFVWCGSGFMLMFTLTVPNDFAPAGWRRTALRAATAVTALIAVKTLFEVLRPELIFSPAIQTWTADLLTAVVILVVIVRLTASSGDERARFGWAALAIVTGMIINDTRNQFSFGPLQMLGTIFGVLTIVTPVLMLYAVLRRHVIDVRFVISRTVVYAVITTVVVGIIGLVDWATSVYLQQARAAMAIDAAVTIGLGFALHRTYRWMERSVDVLLFRQKHEAAEYLRRLGRTLPRAKHEETIDRALVHDPFEKQLLTMAALFRAQRSSFTLSCAAGWNHPDAPVFDADHDIIRFLNSERTTLRLHDLRPHVVAQLHDGDLAPATVIPIFEGDDLFAFALYGVHRDGTKLDPDEVQTLEALCEAASQAYARVEIIRYRDVERRMHPVTG